MKTLQELKAARTKALNDAKAMTDAHKDGMDAEQTVKFDALLAEADRLAGEIEKAEAHAAKLASLNDKLARNTQAQASGALVAPANTTHSAASATVTANFGDNHAVTSGLHERRMDSPTFGYDGVGGFGRFAAEVHAFNTGRGASEGIATISAAAGDGMSQGVTAEGGVLVPPAFSTAIQDRVGMASNNLLQWCDVLPSLPAGTESMEYPIVDESSRADGSRAGGLQGRWKAELTQMSESKPKMRSVRFAPNQLYVFAYITDKLLANAPQCEAFLTARAGDEIAFKSGDAIVNGTGAGMPRGILSGATDAPRVQIAKESQQTAATIVLTNLEKMYARLPARLLAGAAWYINQDVLPALMALTKAVGTGGVPVYMPGGNIAGAPYGTIYGLPVRPIEYCATLGTEGDIILANLGEYGVMTRGGVNSAMSIHLKFDYNQTAFRFIYELDGQPWWNTSLTPYKGSNKQSPFVTLATRS